MEMQERMEAIENDLKQTKEELQEILLDIRTYLMEVQSPIGSSFEGDTHHDELDAGRG